MEIDPPNGEVEKDEKVQSAGERFGTELEFVQCLASPFYLASMSIVSLKCICEIDVSLCVRFSTTSRPFHLLPTFQSNFHE